MSRARFIIFCLCLMSGGAGAGAVFAASQLPVLEDGCPGPSAQLSCSTRPAAEDPEDGQDDPSPLAMLVIWMRDNDNGDDYVRASLSLQFGMAGADAHFQRVPEPERSSACFLPHRECSQASSLESLKVCLQI